jgi:hypothetical protein
MALRGYLLARLDAGLDREAVAELVRALTAWDEVTFAEPVVGAYDLMVKAETAGPLEAVADRLAATEGVCEVLALKVDPIPARERMWRDLADIPLSRQG